MTTRKLLTGIAFAALALGGCGKKDKDPPKQGPTPPATSPKATTTNKAPTGATPNIFSDKKAGPKSVAGFKTPESVLYDADADVYLVSNINGDPFGTDDNGYIAKVTPDGKSEIWIDGAKDDVKLDAPKGLALLGDTLYVADITTVRMFDRKSGAAKGEVAIKGATFLNDLAAGADAVFVSDSGLGPGFKPTGTDAVYKIAAGKATAVIKDKTLGNPNGLAVVGNDVWVVTFGTGQLFRIALGGTKESEAPLKLPKGQLDGIIALAGGDLLISSWEAKTIYRGPADGSKWTELAKDLESPADIGWDSKRNKLLVPLFQKDTVHIIDVKP